MLQKISILLTLILIFALGATTYVLKTHLLANTAYTDMPHALINESMQHVTAHRFNETGHRTQSITMQHWYQHVQDKKIHMEAPSVIVQNTDGSQWLLQSKYGIGEQSDTKGQFENITLLEKVALNQSMQGQHQFILETEQLHFDPRSKQAKTDRLVSVKNDNMNLQAQGLRANLLNREITFVGKVTSTYENTM